MGKQMTHGSLFSGIGGFDLAAEKAGWQNVFHCEWNDFGQKVLKYYWPKAKSYGDITKTDFTIWRGKIDVLSGGFPCQPYSAAGKRKGKEDERHLWPEMLRAIREIQPRYVVGENVFGLINWNDGMVFDEVQADLEAAGYEVQPYVLPAAAVGAPHRRDRVWFVAYSNGSNDRRTSRPDEGKSKKERIQKRNEIWKPAEPSKIQRPTSYATSYGYDAESETRNNKIGSNNKQSRTQWFGSVKRFSDERDASNAKKSRSKGQRKQQPAKVQPNRQGRGNMETAWQNFPTQSPVCGGDDRLPSKLDGITFPKWRNESIKAYGNAIVPQVAYQIFQTINQINKQQYG